MKRFLLALLVLVLAASTAEAQRHRKLFSIYTGAAGDTTGVGMADSTSVLFTGPYERLYLHLQPSRPCRVAIQVRRHGLRDTTGTTFLQDSTNTASWPWRATTVATADSTVWIHSTLATAVLAGEDELVVEFPDEQAAAAKWASPRGKVVSLREIDTGAWYWSRLTTIKLRVLTAGGAVTWKASLEGVSW